MNNLVLAFLVLMTGNLFASNIKNEQIPVSNIYVPTGFDSNDLKEVVVEGYLPNLCYYGPEVTILRDASHDVKFKLSAYKREEDSKACLRVVVPVVQTVSIGVLRSGEYKVIANPVSPYKRVEKITVAQSFSKHVDENIYANVDEVVLKGDEVILKGMNPSDCFALSEVKIIDNNEDAYSILPILERVSSKCSANQKTFEYRAKLPRILNVKKALLHVRAMNGRSVNKIVYLQ